MSYNAKMEDVAQVANKLTSLGSVFQIAYVPRDMNAAIEFWTRTMGAGPFYLMEHIQAENTKVDGKPATLDFSAAIGYWNDLQIELIEQHCDTPSIYTDWIKAGHEGLHHVCVEIKDMAQARKICTESGFRIAQEAQFRGGSAEVIYVDTHGGPGTMIELWKGDDAGRKFFGSIRDAAKGWDGTRPLRRKGE